MKSKLFLIGLLAGMVAIFALASTVSVAQDNAKLPASDLSNPAAAFIFTHDYAVSKGATAEWRKLEGVAADTVNNKVYFADTAVAKSMSDDKGDMKLTENPCGVVWAGDLDANYDTTALSQVVIGGPYDESKADYCNDDAIANPDNMFVDPKGNLWIGEDTDYHHNQMLWMWDGKELKRFATMPEGAEVTGLRIEPDGTIFLNVQHPSATNVYPYNRATVGVITGFKAGDDFTPVEVPTGDAMKSLQIAAGKYQVLARTGEALPGDINNTFVGQILDAAGERTLNTCNNPDGNMFLPTNSAGTEGYLYSNWECVPGGVSKLYIQQASDGKWTSIEGQNVDFSTVSGTQNNCNASVTPWNTALTSEEYPPDDQGEWEGWVGFSKDAMAAYLGKDANPLAYGYIVELTPAGGEEDGIGTKVAKHYSMGRFSKEMTLVMPDSKTAYFGDDGTDRLLYKYVADNAGDLSAGTLYAAKATSDGEKLNLEWLELGKGNDADIAAQVETLGATYGS